MKRHRVSLVWLCACAVLAAACMGSGEPGNLVPKTIGQDESLPGFVLSDGTVLHLQTFGDPSDPVAIVLHGGPGGDHRAYLKFAELMDSQYVVLWDQRGTGLSARVPPAELNGPRYLDDLNELADAFSPDQSIDLVGHSWGGAYATYYTQNYPERVRNLVLIEPGALNPDAAEEGNTAGIDFFDARFHEYLNATDYLIPSDHERADYAYLISLVSFGERDDRLLGYPFWRIGYHANVGINDWQGNFDGSHTFDATEGLHAFTGRTLLIAGEDDGRLGADFQLEFHAPFLPNLEFQEIPNADHADLIERDDVIDAIRIFLGEGAP